jgi:catechol 2,3-dioxygenase-like lactoylglutathione lyase family enzyme
MITGAHVIIYSHDADADRAFVRDILGFDAVDVGGGWLIFKLPPAEVAMHPTEGAVAHELYLMCDDITVFVDDLAAKSVELVRPITDEGWGLLASFRLPSGAEQWVYEPRHPIAHQPDSAEP